MALGFSLRSLMKRLRNILLAALLAPLVCQASAIDFNCRAQLKKSTGDWEATKDDLFDYVFLVRGFVLEELRYYRKGTKTLQMKSQFQPIIDGDTNVPDWYFDIKTGHFTSFQRLDDGTFVATLELSSRLSKAPIQTKTYKGHCAPVR